MGPLRKYIPLSIRDLLPKTLFKRAFLIIGLPLFLVQIVFTVVFLDRYLDSVTRNLANNLSGATRVVTDLYGNHTTVALDLAYELGLQTDFYKNKSLKDIVPIPLDAWEDQYLEIALQQHLGRPFVLSSTAEELNINVEMNKGILVLSMPRKRLMSRTTILVFIWVFGSSIVFLTISSLFMRNQVRPIQKLAQAAENFGKGIEDVSFKISGASEVRQAGKAFNLMRERLKRQIDQRMEMLAGISHDLKTPLTRMKLQLAMLPQNKQHEGLHLDVAKMEALIEEYLSFVRGGHSEKHTEIPLHRLVEECVGDFKDMRLHIKTDVPDDIKVSLKYHSFKRALWNLISNANRYATSAIIRARAFSDHVQIVIEDNGHGIPDDKRQEVFKPFYRLEGSRNTTTGGTGLGLSIAQDIIHSHGGTIELGTASLGGLKVMITLPV